MDNITIEQKLIHIGVRLAGKPAKVKATEWIDIEETIYEATFESPNDARIFLLLCSWVKEHGEHVIIEKLMKLQKRKRSIWLSALAIFAVREGHRAWRKLIRKSNEDHALVPKNIAKQAISYKGADEEFKTFGFLIPRGSLRVRESDVATAEKLIKENHQYRNRFLYGANWRSDIITAIEKGIENPFRITQTIGCSYPSAYRIFKDYKLAMSA